MKKSTFLIIIGILLGIITSAMGITESNVPLLFIGIALLIFSVIFMAYRLEKEGIRWGYGYNP